MLPGGYIFVPAKLLLNSRNEAEFAGMLAHAMAHVAARYGTRLATRAEVDNMASAPLIAMGRDMRYSAAMLVPRQFLMVQRQFELDADRIPVVVTNDAGYDANALIEYIARTKYDAIAARTALPDRDTRIANFEEAIAALPEAPRRATDDRFSEAQREVANRLKGPGAP